MRDNLAPLLSASSLPIGATDEAEVDCCPGSDPPVWVGSEAGTGNGCIASDSVEGIGTARSSFIAEPSEIVGFFGTDSEVSLSLFDVDGFCPPWLPVCTGFGSAPVTEFSRAEKGDTALLEDPTERSAVEAVVDFETIRTPD